VQQLGNIRSYEITRAEHIDKLNNFIYNPTVRPGMEHLPKEVVRDQQLSKMHWLMGEIRNHTNQINRIRGGGL